MEFLFLPAGVKSLQPDSFNGLENVGLLKLAYLDLDKLTSYTFRGLKAVRILSIENSDLATIKDNAFAGNYFLRNCILLKYFVLHHKVHKFCISVVLLCSLKYKTSLPKVLLEI